MAWGHQLRPVPCTLRPCRSPGRGWHPPRKCPLLVPEAGPHPPPLRDPAPVPRPASGQLLALAGERELLTGPRETPDVGHAGRPPAAGEGTAVRSLPLLPVPPPHVHLCPEGLPRARAEPLLGGLLSPKGDAGRGWGSGSQGQPWPHARYLGVQLGWCAQWGAGLQGGE